MITAASQHQRAELPSKNSTHSYWHRDPSKKLLGHRTTEDLPSIADVVVVGSGITGTFAARELVHGGQNVVMLDAREACWGATGRNGGHCQPGVWSNTTDVARFELATFDLIRDLVAKYEIPCDWQVIGGVHSIYSEQVLTAAKVQIERLQQHADLRDKAFLITDKNELAQYRVPQAIGAVYQPCAAKCWPYKLITWLLEHLLSEHEATSFNLQTNTPILRLQRHGPKWTVHTSRGEITARHVLLATNAYTSYLVPDMAGLIVPVRAQVCALKTPQEVTQLAHSHVWLKGVDHQYLIHRGAEDTQLEAADNPLIFGGERFAAPGGEEGISRDDEVNPAVSEALRRGIQHALKLSPAKQPDTEALQVAHEWTGIMGYSRDGSPWVGQVPETLVDGADTVDNTTDGLWLSAGYTGHGMPVAARCGVAVAEMILGKLPSIQLPKGWLMSEERMEMARGMEFPSTIDELIDDYRMKLDALPQTAI